MSTFAAGGRPKIDNLSILPQAVRAEQNGIGIVTQKKLDRLARDYPKLLERVRAGELSAHRAALEAGFISEPTPVETALRAWLLRLGCMQPKRLTPRSDMLERGVGVRGCYVMLRVCEA
jgi:hypothetical protein